ncbi:hypothetical protein [uncultured Tateyamaria sp.]|uniref:hypothetical protein n=1 Tax=uncultured Tateyamaria sp. TaxID=455651 RepID=UPI002629EE3A|nr:hypothetical protein [uncultured Tateyamaria sp.]
MAFTWDAESQETRPHRGVDPVSAWLIRQGAPVAGPGGGASDTPRHAGIIDLEPSNGAVGETIVVLDTKGRARTALSEDQVNAALDGLNANRSSAARVDISDPRIFLLPLHPRSMGQQADGTVDRVVNAPSDIEPWLSPGLPPRAIVGIIDHAINIFHHRFQFEAGAESRVAYAWMQGGVFQEAEDGLDPVPFGREWTRDEIGEVLRLEGDQDALLRALDADFTTPGFHPLALRTAHGTHVLDLAAGMEPDRESGRGLPIIAVNLPPEVARDPTGSVLGLFFVQGFDYILKRARSIMADVGTQIPVYVNFSFGLSGGMRRGRHFLERAIRRSIARHQARVAADFSQTNVKVFLPAGNRNLAQGHVVSTGSATLETIWQIQPGDTSANHADIRIEIETPSGTPTLRLRLALTPPGTDTPVEAEFDRAGQAHILRQDGGDLGRAFLRSEGRSRDVMLFNLSIALGPSDPGLSGRPALPPGGWGLKITLLDTAPIRMDAWILRDDTPPGYQDTGRQSYFVDSEYKKWDRAGQRVVEDPDGADQGLLRAGSLNALATSAVPTVVGGVFGHTASGLATNAPKAVPYSATPLAPQSTTRETIDLSAPAERSPLRLGVLAAGTRSGSRVALNGSSVAAPQALRVAVDASDTLPGVLDPTPEDQGSARVGERVTLGTVENQITDAPRA